MGKQKTMADLMEITLNFIIHLCSPFEMSLILKKQLNLFLQFFATFRRKGPIDPNGPFISSSQTKNKKCLCPRLKPPYLETWKIAKNCIYYSSLS